MTFATVPQAYKNFVLKYGLKTKKGFPFEGEAPAIAGDEVEV